MVNIHLLAPTRPYSSCTGETEWSLNGSVAPYDVHICSLTLTLPNPLPIRRFWCAGVMFVVTSSLRLSHIVLISVVSPHLRSDRTYRYSSHRTGTGADQIKGYFSRRGRKYVDNQTLSRSFSSLSLSSELIDTINLNTVLVSPRRRAHDTFHLLTDHLPQTPHHVFTEDVREWDYGDYEGLKPHEIKAIQPTWSIWKDGLVIPPYPLFAVQWRCSCPNGESVEEMTARVDCVIGQVRIRSP